MMMKMMAFLMMIFFDEIVRHKMIPRQTNWRFQLIVLNQCEVAQAAAL
jgi:hypothetical protein